MRIVQALGRVGRLVHNPKEHALAGIGNSVLNVAAAQSALGHDVSVYGFSEPLPTGTGTWQGVKITTVQPWKWARATSRLDASLLLPLSLQILKQAPVDVLHVHEIGLLYLPLARLRVVHLHIPLGQEIGQSHLWRRADGVICVSEYLRKTFLAICDYPAERAFVVHNGATIAVDPGSNREVVRTRQRLGIPLAEVMVLFVGALVPKKAPDLFLKALRYLVADEPRYRERIRPVVVGGSELWRMRGSAREADEYEAELKLLGEASDAKLLGLLPHRETLRLQQACDIVVVPSIAEESHPLVVCEAMAAGKPVIASRVGGIPETVLDGKTGILYPPGDQEALAAAMRRLVDDADLRRLMGEAALTRARLFTWEVAAQKLDQIYHNLLEAKRASW